MTSRSIPALSVDPLSIHLTRSPTWGILAFIGMNLNLSPQSFCHDVSSMLPTSKELQSSVSIEPMRLVFLRKMRDAPTFREPKTQQEIWCLQWSPKLSWWPRGKSHPLPSSSWRKKERDALSYAEPGVSLDLMHTSRNLLPCWSHV